jgi:hypothetical protein
MEKSMATPSLDIRMEIREKVSTEKICWMDRLELSTFVFLCFCFIILLLLFYDLFICQTFMQLQFFLIFVTTICKYFVYSAKLNNLCETASESLLNL